jgi:nucleoside permease NupC
MERLHSLLGLFALAVLALLFSERRKEVNLRTLFAGLGLQILLAFLFFKISGSQSFFLWLNSAVEALEESTQSGASFVFGYLGGVPLPFDERSPGLSYILAFRGLPLVLVISAISALLYHWKVLPLTEKPSTGRLELPVQTNSAMDAITQGTLDGMRLLLNIVAMLVVLVAIVHLLNLLLSVFPNIFGEPITFQRLLGCVMAPVTWLMGIPWSEAQLSGTLLGTKTVLNELLAYSELARLPEDALSGRSELIMTYAMCGFANLGSLGIMIGGVGAMIPQRREEVVNMGLKSIVAGTLATCMTGAVVGFFRVKG